MVVKYNKYYISSSDNIPLSTDNPNEVDSDVEKIGDTLKYWPGEVAAMPTDFSRVALFAVIQRGRRKDFKNHKLASRSDVQIYFSGEQLDQADADLWLSILQMGRGKSLGKRIYTTDNKLLSGIGRSHGTSGRNWLDGSLERLSKAFLRVVIKKKSGGSITVNCHLMSSGIDSETGDLFVRLDPEGAPLFNSLSYVDWQTRLSLKSNMAKSLQMYVSGHAMGNKHSVLLEELKLWTGYEGRIRDFYDSVLIAFSALEKEGIIEMPTIIDGKSGKTVAQWTRPLNRKISELN